MSADGIAPEPEPAPAAQLVKYSVSIAGHRTSVSLEPKFWELLRVAAAERQMSINALISEIDETREGNLSSSIRLFVLDELIRNARD